MLFTGSTVTGDYENASIEVLSLKTGQWKVVQRGGTSGGTCPRQTGPATWSTSTRARYLRWGLTWIVWRSAVLRRLVGRCGGECGYRLSAVRRCAEWDVGLSERQISAAGWPVSWMDSTGKTKPLLAAPGPYYTPRFSPDGKRLALAVGPFGATGIFRSTTGSAIR